MTIFARFRDLRGWSPADVAVLYGTISFAIGLLTALAAGVRDIGRTILDGGLEVHLGRPRHPLPSLLLSRSSPSGFGDIASAIPMFLWLGGRSLAELPLIVAMAAAGAVIIVATLATAHALVFWWPHAARLDEEVLFNATIMISVYPQHVYGIAVRLELFTVLPVGFVALVPVEAVRAADPKRALIVFAAAVFYSAVAVAVFDRGLRRYRSGNLVTENRYRARRTRIRGSRTRGRR